MKKTVLSCLVLCSVATTSIAAPAFLCGVHLDSSNIGTINADGPKIKKATKRYFEDGLPVTRINYFSDNKIRLIESYRKGVKVAKIEYRYKGGLLTDIKNFRVADGKKTLVVIQTEKVYYDDRHNAYKYESTAYDEISGKASFYVLTFLNSSREPSQIGKDVYTQTCLEYSAVGKAAHAREMGEPFATVYRVGPQGVVHKVSVNPSTSPYTGSASDEAAIYAYLTSALRVLPDGTSTRYETGENGETSEVAVRESSGDLIWKQWRNAHGDIFQFFSPSFTENKTPTRSATKFIYDENGNTVKRVRFTYKFNGLAAAEKYTFVEDGGDTIEIEYEN